MTDTTFTLTDQERDAELELDQLKQLVGLVPYDETQDVFPVTGWDAIVFVVG
ncbi:MAG: 4-hydroxyphenylpyruvate dioxygenase, partial [Actinomycetota bacterium]|nr:4-hydroxyphenylpyruvate dioxygenase [Actinomycetota bacterium]